MYILRPHAAGILYAPPFYTPPTPRRVISGVGGWGCIKIGPVFWALQLLCETRKRFGEHGSETIRRNPDLEHPNYHQLETEGAPGRPIAEVCPGCLRFVPHLVSLLWGLSGNCFFFFSLSLSVLQSFWVRFGERILAAFSRAVSFKLLFSRRHWYFPPPRYSVVLMGRFLS